MERARAVVASTPGLAETLAGDWREAARYYVMFSATEELLRYGAPTVMTVTDFCNGLSSADHFADGASLR